MKTMKITTLLGLFALMLIPTALFAATNPDDPGETSTGTSDISVDIPPLVKISGIQDLTYNDYTGHPDGITRANLNQDVCIYSNLDTDGGSYSVTLSGTSTGAPAGFTITSGDGLEAWERIAYSAFWNDASGIGGGEEMDHGDPDDGFENFSNLIDCDGTPNANFSVSMTQANLLAVRPGTYTGTLTILIAPD